MGWPAQLGLRQRFLMLERLGELHMGDLQQVLQMVPFQQPEVEKV
jgi:hypothetical protein